VSPSADANISKSKPCESILPAQARPQGTQTPFGFADRAPSARRVNDRTPRGDLDRFEIKGVSYVTKVDRKQ
jgi:hypothetical protein